MDLEVDFGKMLGLSGKDILSVESVDDDKPEIGFEGGEGDGDDEFDGRRLERGLNFDIIRCYYYVI
jgi:hypothetical protein